MKLPTAVVVAVLWASALIAPTLAAPLHTEPCPATLDIQTNTFSCEDCYAFYPETTFLLDVPEHVAQSEGTERMCRPVTACSVAPSEPGEWTPAVIRQRASDPSWVSTSTKNVVPSDPLMAQKRWSSLMAKQRGIHKLSSIEMKSVFLYNMFCNVKSEQRLPGLTPVPEAVARFYKTASSPVPANYSCVHEDLSLFDTDTKKPVDKRVVLPEIAALVCGRVLGLHKEEKEEEEAEEPAGLVLAPCSATADRTVLNMTETRLTRHKDGNRRDSEINVIHHTCPTVADVAGQREQAVYDAVVRSAITEETKLYTGVSAESTGAAFATDPVSETPVDSEKCTRKLVHSRVFYRVSEDYTTKQGILSPDDFLLPYSAHVQYNATSKTVHWVAVEKLHFVGSCSASNARFVCSNRDSAASEQLVKEVEYMRGSVVVTIPEQPLTAFENSSETPGSLLWGIETDDAGVPRAYLDSTAVRCPDYTFSVEEVDVTPIQTEKCGPMNRVSVRASLLGHGTDAPGVFATYTFERSSEFASDGAVLEWSVIPHDEQVAEDENNVYELESGLRIRAWDRRSADNKARVSLVKLPTTYRPLTETGQPDPGFCATAALPIYHFTLISECGGSKLKDQEILGIAQTTIPTGPIGAPVFTRVPSYTLTDASPLQFAISDALSGDSAAVTESQLVEYIRQSLQQYVNAEATQLVAAVTELVNGTILSVPVVVDSVRVDFDFNRSKCAESDSGVIQAMATFTATDMCGKVQAIENWPFRTILRSEKTGAALRPRRLTVGQNSDQPLRVRQFVFCAAIPDGFSGITVAHSRILAAVRSVATPLAKTIQFGEPSQTNSVFTTTNGKKNVSIHDATIHVIDECGADYEYPAQFVLEAASTAQCPMGYDKNTSTVTIKLQPSDLENVRAVTRAYQLARRVRRPVPELAILQTTVTDKEIAEMSSLLQPSSTPATLPKYQQQSRSGELRAGIITAGASNAVGVPSVIGAALSVVVTIFIVMAMGM